MRYALPQKTCTPRIATPPHSAWQLAGCQAACQRLATASAVPTTLPAACAAHCYVYDSALDGLVKIVRQEGMHTLWTGTGMSLLMAVPSVGTHDASHDR